MRKRRLRGFPARRQRPRLAALEDAAAYFYARIIRRIKKERHALLDDRVRGRKRLSERFVEVGWGRGLEVDYEHRRIFMSEQLQKPLGPTPRPVRFHQPLEALGRASIVFNQAEEPKRV